MCKVNKILKMLELDVYRDEPLRSDFVRYIKLNGYNKIKEGFINNDYSVIGEVLFDNQMLAYGDVEDVLTTIKLSIN